MHLCFRLTTYCSGCKHFFYPLSPLRINLKAISRQATHSCLKINGLLKNLNPFVLFRALWLASIASSGHLGSDFSGCYFFITLCFSPTCCLSLLSIILFTKKIRMWSKRGPLQFSFFIELLLLCWFLLLTLSPMLKSVPCEKLELSSLVSEWPPDTLPFLSKPFLQLPLESFCVLEPLSFSQIPESGDLCPCSWAPGPPMPTHLPDTLSNLDREWQATDWRVETFRWHIYPLQCPGARTFDFRGI